MPPVITNSLASLLSALLAVLGVTLEPSNNVKAVTVAVCGLVVAVIQWQQHRTIRHHVTAAADVAVARAAVAAAASPAPAPGAAPGPLDGHLSPAPASSV